MELTLLGTAGLAAFLIGGAAVMIVASFRRTIALREALVHALKRIERLEAQLALDPSARYSAPAAEPPPQAQPAPQSYQPASYQPAPSPAPEPAYTRIETPTHATAPAARNSFLPTPSAHMVMFGSGLAAFAALAAAKLNLIAGVIGFAIAMLIAVLTFACAEWRRQSDLADERHSFRFVPPQASIMALFSFTLALASLIYARNVLDAPLPEIALALAALTALAAALLAERYGPWLLAASIVAAFAAPAFLVGSYWAQTGQAIFIIAYLATMAAIARQRLTPIWMWAASGIASYWVLIGVIDAETPRFWFTACAASVVIAIAYAWTSAKTAIVSTRSFLTFSAPEALTTGALLALASCLLFLGLLITHAQSVAGPGASLLIIALAATIAAAIRPALQSYAALSALTAIIAIVIWPNNIRGAINAADLLSTGAALGLIFSVGGGASLFRADSRASGAYLAALAPIGVLAALHQRLGGFGGEAWAMAALSLAVFNALAYAQWAKSKPPIATAFAAGSALSIAAALYVTAPDRFAGFSLALSLCVFAAFEFWRTERGVRIAALIAAPLSALALIAPEIAAPATSAPALIGLSFGASAATAWVAGRLFEAGPARAKSDAAQAGLALCLFLIGAMGSLIARHLFTAGAIGAHFDNLGELAAHVLIWLGLAVLMAWRMPKRGRRILFALEVFSAGVALTLSLVAGLILINPWWGLAPAAAPSWNGLSVILAAYGAPALLMLTYAHLRGQQGMETRSGVALTAGLALLFAAITLELRRRYHGAEMASAPILPAEAWAYSAAWIGMAALMFALSAERHGKLLRYASLGLALITIAKAALFDLDGLNGFTRLAAFVGLIAAGGGLIWFYRRFVLQSGPARLKTDLTTPELTPPEPTRPQPTKALAEQLSPPG